jgi:hypothetical protein
MGATNDDALVAIASCVGAVVVGGAAMCVLVCAFARRHASRIAARDALRANGYGRAGGPPDENIC